MVRRYATGDGVPKADKVIVVISAPMNAQRKLRDGTTINEDHAIEFWKELFPEVANLPGVEFVKGNKEMRSPITIAYEYISERSPLPLKNGDKVILGASNKLDKAGGKPDWTRWNDVDDEKHVKHGIELLRGEEYAVPALAREGGGSFSASTARDLISDLVDNPSNKEAYVELSDFVPAHRIGYLFDTLKKPRPIFVDKDLEETSMAGAIVGAPGVIRNNKDDPTIIKHENIDLSTIDEVMRLIMDKEAQRLKDIQMNKKENILRENIRQMIRCVKQKKSNNENSLREVIRGFMDVEMKSLLEGGTPDVDPSPNKSTGINVLEELLKKIIPVLETDYKSLTTDISQRKSFRAHIINAAISTLTPAKINTDAADADVELKEVDIDEEIYIKVGGHTDDKFIDIRTDAEKSAEDEDDDDPRDAFGSGVEGDKTGRNMAYQSFKKIETNIIDAYELLSNDEDQELFYDYLVANLKLYFDKFEGELSDTVEEPTNQAYAMAKADEEAGTDDEDLALEEYINSL